MEDVLTTLSRLNRPKLLVQTARHGIDDYNRLVHLRRLLKVEHVPGPSQAILALLELELVMDQLRLDHRAEYSVARHVEMIIALMCEARILKASRASARADQDGAPLHAGSNVQQVAFQ